MVIMKIEPDGWSCPLEELRPGLFTFPIAGTIKGMGVFIKTEYHTDSGNMEVFCCDSGEAFWGGVSNEQDRRKLVVQPVKIVIDNI